MRRVSGEKREWKSGVTGMNDTALALAISNSITNSINTL